MDFDGLLDTANEALSGLTDILKPEKKDPSAMCEFTIKGSETFVYDCLELILNK